MATLSEFLRHGWISSKRRAETAEQRSEPRLEVPPVVNRFAGNRTAHLLGTRSQDDPLRLVKAQTALFERQAKKLEELARFLLRVFDDGFIIDAVNLVGKHALEVRHHRQVVAIGFGKFV